jgi:hypothetical protein
VKGQSPVKVTEASGDGGKSPSLDRRQSVKSRALDRAIADALLTFEKQEDDLNIKIRDL